MNEAIYLSAKGITSNQGGPFGCVVVKNDQIVGRGHNQVTSTNDPTAHAEVVAIRDACKNLQTFQLDDCEIYTSCEWVLFIGQDPLRFILPTAAQMPPILALTIL